MNRKKQLRVLLADPDELFRLRLRKAFCNSVVNAIVVGTVGTTVEATEFAKRHPVDMVVMETHFLGSDFKGIEAIRTLAGIRPELQVAMVSQDASAALKAYQAGAAYYIVKTPLAHAISQVLEVVSSNTGALKNS
ncbi:response regulator [Alicyclobacillus tolerans]|uniref:response regulator n=1 Tax=Alicyclobacillus tolerans TaxID=90970 RepID=UPI001F00707D|nr:response regulator [Alicyclobacillus tolerans]MCF8566568.1 response regulator [Alicyclobacillus tolerans]